MRSSKNPGSSTSSRGTVKTSPSATLTGSPRAAESLQLVHPPGPPTPQSPAPCPPPSRSSSPEVPLAPSLFPLPPPPLPRPPPPSPPPPATKAPGFIPGIATMLGAGAVLGMVPSYQDPARSSMARLDCAALHCLLPPTSAIPMIDPIGRGATRRRQGGLVHEPWVVRLDARPEDGSWERAIVPARVRNGARGNPHGPLRLFPRTPEGGCGDGSAHAA